jgi:hypothetical protein
VVYARRVNGKDLTFMVSGMLWRDSLVMLDRETETLWSHVTGEALRGPLKGKKLEALPVVQTTWERWLKTHPDTQVLAKDEAVDGPAFAAYQSDPERFGLGRAKRAIEKLPGKALVHGTVVSGAAVAVTEAAMEKAPEREASVTGKKVLFRRTPDGGIRAFDGKSGKELPVTRAYWFAWIAFYPGTQLIE